MRIVELASEGKLSADAAVARDYALSAGVTMQSDDGSIELSEGVIVDALLGTGTKGPMRAAYVAAIDRINQAGLPVLAIDLPSGLYADSGAIAEVAVRADISVTFIAAKQGYVLWTRFQHCVERLFTILWMSMKLFFSRSPGSAQLMNLDDLMEHLPVRDADAYKNQFGHSLVIGGDHGFGGGSIDGC